MEKVRLTLCWSEMVTLSALSSFFAFFVLSFLVFVELLRFFSVAFFFFGALTAVSPSESTSGFLSSCENAAPRRSVPARHSTPSLQLG